MYGWVRCGVGTLEAIPRARYIPVKHGFPPPDTLNNRHVLMVDFSYHRETIEALAKQAASLYILDHHVTAQAALADFPFAYFDMTRSRAVLAWEWVHSGLSLALAICAR